MPTFPPSKCGSCQEDINNDGHKPACVQIGEKWDAYCPACGHWGGRHGATSPNCFFGWQGIDSSLALTFGRWGARSSMGLLMPVVIGRVQSAPAPNGAAIPSGAKTIHQAIMKSVQFAGEQPKAKRLCECGAWATGAADYSAAHSNSPGFTCPAFRAFKPQPDNLVAVIRSTPKKLRP